MPVSTAHQQEIDVAYDHVAQVVSCLVILKLYVQAVLNAHLHLQASMTKSAMVNGGWMQSARRRLQGPRRGSAHAAVRTLMGRPPTAAGSP